MLCNLSHILFYFYFVDLYNINGLLYLLVYIISSLARTNNHLLHSNDSPPPPQYFCLCSNICVDIKSPETRIQRHKLESLILPKGTIKLVYQFLAKILQIGRYRNRMCSLIG